MNIQTINAPRYVSKEGIRAGPILKVIVCCVILVSVQTGYICQLNGLETMVDCKPELGAFSLN